jgi:hypothetical protein
VVVVDAEFDANRRATSSMNGSGGVFGDTVVVGAATVVVADELSLLLLALAMSRPATTRTATAATGIATFTQVAEAMYQAQGPFLATASSGPGTLL